MNNQECKKMGSKKIGIVLGLLIVASCGKKATEECKPVIYETVQYQKSSLESKTSPVIHKQLSDDEDFKLEIQLSNRTRCSFSQDGLIRISPNVLYLTSSIQAQPVIKNMNDDEILFLRNQLNETLSSDVKRNNELSDTDCDGMISLVLFSSEPQNYNYSLKYISPQYCDNGRYTFHVQPPLPIVTTCSRKNTNLLPRYQEARSLSISEELKSFIQEKCEIAVP